MWKFWFFLALVCLGCLVVAAIIKAPWQTVAGYGLAYAGAVVLGVLGRPPR